jgi:hypothetical protein
MPNFLSFPLEVRARIYYYTLENDITESEISKGRLFSTTRQLPPLNLLLTCKQIHLESRPYYYAGALLSFSSIERLESRIRLAPDHITTLINHVRIVGIQLNTFQDIDHNESAILKYSLFRLPNLKTFGLNLDLLSLAESYPTPRFEICCTKTERMVNTLAKYSPKLQNLGLLSLPINLEFLLYLEQLRVFHFTGYSKNPPDHALHVFEQLPLLDTVIIEDSRAVQHICLNEDLGTETWCSFSPDVASELNHLKHLRFLAEDSAGFRSEFIVPEMIDGARLLADNLQSFTLNCRFCVRRDDILVSTLALLDHCSRLEDVDISFWFSPTIPYGKGSWLRTLLETSAVSLRKYSVQVEQIPGQSHPWAIGIRIQTTSGGEHCNRPTKAGYTKPKQHTKYANRWISYQVLK